MMLSPANALMTEEVTSKQTIASHQAYLTLGLPHLSLSNTLSGLE